MQAAQPARRNRPPSLAPRRAGPIVAAADWAISPPMRLFGSYRARPACDWLPPADQPDLDIIDSVGWPWGDPVADTNRRRGNAAATALRSYVFACPCLGHAGTSHTGRLALWQSSGVPTSNF
jgi:hypothetical protein